MSNDGHLRLYSTAGVLVAEADTGGETLYAVASNPHAGGDFPELIVGGEAGTCKVYAVAPTPAGKIALHLVESILHPAAVYGVAVSPQGDLVTACEDNTARVFTRDAERVAPLAARDLYRAKVHAVQGMRMQVDEMAPPAGAAPHLLN